jgi:hypothetical protein
MKAAIAGQSLLVFLFAPLLLGCGSSSPQGWGVRVVDWSQSTPGTPTVPGIDDAAVRIGLYGNRPILVVWYGGGGGGFEAGWDGTRKAVHYKGDFASREGQKLAVECFTSDGKTGAVTIGGETFELGNGSLFLVAPGGTKTLVKQLRRDPSKLGSDSEGFKAYAKSEAEIKAFFEKPRRSEP